MELHLSIIWISIDLLGPQWSVIGVQEEPMDSLCTPHDVHSIHTHRD